MRPNSRRLWPAYDAVTLLCLILPPLTSYFPPPSSSGVTPFPTARVERGPSKGAPKSNAPSTFSLYSPRGGLAGLPVRVVQRGLSEAARCARSTTRRIRSVTFVDAGEAVSRQWFLTRQATPPLSQHFAPSVRQASARSLKPEFRRLSYTFCWRSISRS